MPVATRPDRPCFKQEVSLRSVAVRRDVSGRKHVPIAGRRDRRRARWPPPRSRRTPSRSRSAISVVPGSGRRCRWSQQPADNDGVAGARLAIEDNNTTGRFQNQHFSLDEIRLKGDDDPAKAALALADRNVSFVVADLPAEALLKAADADPGSRHRAVQCRRRRRPAARRGLPRQCDPHRADPLDARRRASPNIWSGSSGSAGCWCWVRIREDKLLADALRRAATRFGAKIVQERVFEDSGGARHTDSGVTLIQRQIPVFTQQAPSYDVLVAADESEVFGSYLPYRTWDARPVAGSAGLGADQLGRGAGSMGRGADPEPLSEAQFAADDGAGHAGLDRGADDRRSGVTHQFRRSQNPVRTSSRVPIFRSPPSRASG